MEIGIDSFAAAFDEKSRAVNPAARLRHLIEQIEHADEIGLDALGVGELHRREFLDSAPTVILGAAAVRTRRIRLTSAVTVLSAAGGLSPMPHSLPNSVISSFRDTRPGRHCCSD